MGQIASHTDLIRTHNFTFKYGTFPYFFMDQVATLATGQTDIRQDEVNQDRIKTRVTKVKKKQDRLD